MPAPFYDAIKGTTSGAPGTGAFTPNAAPTGYRAWATVPPGWIGMVRFEDGTAWELSYCYWNGTTISRSANQLYDSSTGSALSLTSAATAAMIIDASEVMSHLGGTAWRAWIGVPAGSVGTLIGLASTVVTGTAGAVSQAATNYFTMQPRILYTSATTANAQAGISFSTVAVYSTTAGLGGFEFVARWGASQLPTGPRLFVGMSAGTFVGNTAEPSAFTQSYSVFAKDSTDTNIQFLNNSNVGGGTKIDTGIPLVANGWYESSIWAEPGGGKLWGLLVRLDTGDIWLGSTTTDIMATGAILAPYILGGLNGSNTGTAIIFHVGGMCVRSGQ